MEDDNKVHKASLIELRDCIGYGEFNTTNKRGRTTVRRTKILIILFLTLVFLSIAMLIIRSRLLGLPSGAVNGEWSARAVAEQHPIIADSFEQLLEIKPDVVRVRVLNSRSESIPILQREFNVNHIFTIYEIEVLEVYRGNMDTGKIVEIMQVERLRGRNLISFNFFRPQHIRIPISVGCEYILFFSYTSRIIQLWPYQVHPIQGIYHYTPEYMRAGYNNWTFESVNEHNNLVLTERDLLRISTS